MRRARLILMAAPLLALGLESSFGQVAASAATANSPLNQSGYVNRDGRKIAYLVRHLPVDSFPGLPAAVQAELNRRGCLIPQSYEAHHPENVVHGAFEKAGSADWAVLCAAQGTVSLLVFFASAPDKPVTLAFSAETQHLEPHDLTGVLGFDWAIDAASPERVHDGQSGMGRKPARVDHDALADSILDRKTVYHFYSKGEWMLLDVAE
jgi:hypothetical protein